MKNQYLKGLILILIFYAFINSCKKINENSPVADFKVSSDKIYIDDKINFTDLSINEPDFWLWDFGDGTKTNHSNPEYKYSSAGIFTVTLKVSNEAGIDTKSDVISVLYQEVCPDVTTITDMDGNEYKTVLIGDQCWMAENLKTTKFSDGSSISIVYSNREWYERNTPASAWYRNNYNEYGVIYGALYNWYAVNTAKLCPAGWHVPTHDEWKTMTDFLGGSSVSGGKLKQIETEYWKSPNLDATNVTGFTALPAGYRNGFDGSYNNLGSNAYFWTATEIDEFSARQIRLSHNSNAIFDEYFYEKTRGKSIRCVKD